jgi:hypothetical protein
MRYLFLLAFVSVGAGLFAQTNVPSGTAAQIAPGARAQLQQLLNKATMVSPAVAAPLGKNWFRLETDAHLFSDEVSVRQVSAVFTDIENHDKIFNGKKSLLTASVISRGQDGTVADFVATTIAPMGIKIRAPYRATVTVLENTGAKVAVGIRQLASDSASNNTVREMYTMRYAEAVTIDGKAYTYVRIYIIDEANGSILPGAKGVLESQSGPAVIEALELIIKAAKIR